MENTEYTRWGFEVLSLHSSHFPPHRNSKFVRFASHAEIVYLEKYCAPMPRPEVRASNSSTNLGSFDGFQQFKSRSVPPPPPPSPRYDMSSSGRVFHRNLAASYSQGNDSGSRGSRRPAPLIRDQSIVNLYPEDFTLYWSPGEIAKMIVVNTVE